MHLEIKDISVQYGNVVALKKVSIGMKNSDSIVALIGANGAGKTTVLNAISGLTRPTIGEIWFAGHRLNEKSPSTIVEMGITYILERRGLFDRMNVWENLMMGAYLCKDKQNIKENLERAYTYFPTLKDRASQQAGSLSGGEQQMLAIARALMSNPKLLLVDEPSIGLSPVLVEKTIEILENICKEEKVGILLVEQNASLALQMAETGYVLENGRVVMQGRGCDLLNNEKVRKAYLGL
ncbi:MAG: ABC transporter ATP-binding protein [Deltaproteobacteria bacterium]|nr:ABC transporter ATP-binding protein [Deltaproteobacteria bacterium]